MNDILSLKGKFEHRHNEAKFRSPEIKVDDIVTSVHIRQLVSELEDIRKYWQDDTLIDGALVSVHYTRIIPKSRRLSRLLSVCRQSPSLSVRGSRFEKFVDSKGEDRVRHVFTHYVSVSVITRAIELLEASVSIIDKFYEGVINGLEVQRLSSMKEFPFVSVIKKTVFAGVMFDVSNIDSFSIDDLSDSIANSSIVSIYRTGVSLPDIMKKIGINVITNRMVNDNTLHLRKDEFELLKSRAPYLISMNVPDMAELTKDDVVDKTDVLICEKSPIPSPVVEPVIGVIDTMFNPDAYFSEWVEFYNLLDIPEYEPSLKDMEHGTEVDSIIVDGPALNPWLQDGCGRFRVRHFGVATAGGFSSFNILKQIRRIVVDNSDIRVWNISLGSIGEIEESSISPVGAELDRLQHELDVLFVVAGTNKNNNSSGERIGAPADSLNSIVVNAVDFEGRSPDYTRVGPVLGFFNKPDVCYYGGSGYLPEDRIAVSDGSFLTKYQKGTSFAAPWITRKMAFLICKLGLSRQVAKALLLDSAMGWKSEFSNQERMGYGLVPIDINKIIHTENDEIRFYISGSAENYETYNFNLPVPVVENEHPYYARATMVYFPECIREQGVDYTCTELDLKFGRVSRKAGKVELMAVKHATQQKGYGFCRNEEDARKEYRKWDNVKHVVDKTHTRRTHIKVYESGLWGISVVAMERLSTQHDKSLPFGIVVTLKEKDGVNRIDDFMRQCMAKGWIVNRLEVQSMLDVYETAEETIVWD